MPAAQEKPTGLVTTTTQPALDTALLPLYSDPDLVLEPTTISEYEQTWRLNAGEWKGFLSEPSYLDREMYLTTGELTRDGGATGWILTSPRFSVTEDGSRVMLASCETNRKNAYVAKDGKVDKIITHGIGSVHCRHEYRGKGYGAKMIAMLSEKLDTFQQLKGKRGTFSVLYSDIGPKFYAKHGWKPFPSTHISLKSLSNEGEYQQRCAAITPGRQIKDLGIQDIQSLAPTFITSLESKLIMMSSAQPNKTFVAFKPELAQFEWHFMREEFLAENLGRSPPTVKGALDIGTGVALVWSRTYSADSSEWHLCILYFHVPQDIQDLEEVHSAVCRLLLRAQWEASVWGLEAGVEVWDPSNVIVQAAQAVAYGENIKVVARDEEHICSLKWNGSEAEADDVVWIANEKYAWC